MVAVGGCGIVIELVEGCGGGVIAGQFEDWWCWSLRELWMDCGRDAVVVQTGIW